MKSDLGSGRPRSGRILLWVLCVCLLPAEGLAEGENACSSPKFSGFEQVRQEAERLASLPFQAPDESLPKEFADLGYEAYKSIRYKPDGALWRKEGLPFQVEFYARGRDFKHRIEMNQVDDGCLMRVPYSPDLFTWEVGGEERKLPENLGFAGFFLLYPLNRPDREDVLISFLGASYFRAVGRGQVFGASARGVAVDTGLPGVKEQFPFYSEFWLRKPEPGDDAMTVDALMQGRSVCGASRYVVRPGVVTIVDVNSSFFLRAPVERFGAAPLTSMYLRRQVHDSDGLLIAKGSGQWDWRPLENPAEVRVVRFETEDIRGFGLIQRDRDPAHYADPGDRYSKRPSVWVEPLGTWGRGSVLLIELPSETSNEDNMVALWEPAGPVRAGEKLQYAYRLHYTLGEPSGHRPGSVLETRSSALKGGAQKFVVDFGFQGTGKGHGEVGPSPRAVARATKGEVGSVTLSRKGSEDVWRLSFDVRAVGKDPVELTAFLEREGNILSEVWSYTWRP